jgi:prevent-host-death family protein
VATQWLIEEVVLTITTLTSREFKQDTSRAKKAAMDGPVFITDRGTPTHVLLSIDEYQRMTGGQGSIIDRLGMPPGVEDADIEIPPMRDLVDDEALLRLVAEVKETAHEATAALEAALKSCAESNVRIADMEAAHAARSKALPRTSWRHLHQR